MLKGEKGVDYRSARDNFILAESVFKERFQLTVGNHLYNVSIPHFEDQNNNAIYVDFEAAQEALNAVVEALSKRPEVLLQSPLLAQCYEENSRRNGIASLIDGWESAQRTRDVDFITDYNGRKYFKFRCQFLWTHPLSGHKNQGPWPAVELLARISRALETSDASPGIEIDFWNPVLKKYVVSRGEIIYDFEDKPAPWYRRAFRSVASCVGLCTAKPSNNVHPATLLTLEDELAETKALLAGELSPDHIDKISAGQYREPR